MSTVPEYSNIRGFSNMYATPDGKIYKRNGDKFRVVKISTNSKGYTVCGAKPDGEDTYCRIYILHTLIAKAFDPNYEGGAITHIDGNQQNNNFSNLCYKVFPTPK
jgi:hypothetical protein